MAIGRLVAATRIFALWSFALYAGVMGAVLEGSSNRLALLWLLTSAAAMAGAGRLAFAFDRDQRHGGSGGHPTRGRRAPVRIPSRRD
jgi:hypothetical protein